MEGIGMSGAVSVRNKKGELSILSTKVHRYVQGKRPHYASQSTADEESDNDDNIIMVSRSIYTVESNLPLDAFNDRRIKRLGGLIAHKSRVTSNDSSDEDIEVNRRSRKRMISNDKKDNSDNNDDEELSDGELESKRQRLRRTILNKNLEKKRNQIFDIENESQTSEDDSSECDDESSEDEDDPNISREEPTPRFKHIFVKQSDRVTLLERDKDEIRRKPLQYSTNKLQIEKRKTTTLKIVEEEIRKERVLLAQQNSAFTRPNLSDVNTDDEDNEIEFKAWTLRELKRTKRDKEESKQRAIEKAETERIRNLTEIERTEEIKLNPRIITNAATKGKYKFMQKCYHRGSFYLDEENSIFKRDYSTPTEGDIIDKTVIPKVMQVKIYGFSGGTKYTHLFDQDTTTIDSPWTMKSTQNSTFLTKQYAGMKQEFEKPTLKKKFTK